MTSRTNIYTWRVSHGDQHSRVVKTPRAVYLIISIKLTAVPAACRLEQIPQQHRLPSSDTSGIDQTAPLPAVISHLLFEPTLLASTGRRRFTLRNDTTGDLPVRWEISEILPLQQEKKHQQQPLKRSGAGFAPGSPTVWNTIATGTRMAEPSRQRTQHEAGATVPASAAATATAGGGVGRDQAAGTEGTRRTPRQEAGVTPAAVSPTSRSIDGRDGRNRADLGSSSTSIAASSSIPPSSSVVGATVVLTAAAAAVRAAPDDGPFGVFPEFAVVPAHGEFAFEVAFSPCGLEESR